MTGASTLDCLSRFAMIFLAATITNSWVGRFPTGIWFGLHGTVAVAQQQQVFSLSPQESDFSNHSYSVLRYGLCLTVSLPGRLAWPLFCQKHSKSFWLDLWGQPLYNPFTCLEVQAAVRKVSESIRTICLPHRLTTLALSCFGFVSSCPWSSCLALLSLPWGCCRPHQVIEELKISTAPFSCKCWRCFQSKFRSLAWNSLILSWFLYIFALKFLFPS